MNQLTLIEQISKLLPHWAEHLDGHVTDLAHWRNEAEGVIGPGALAHILDAEEKMKAASHALESAFLAIKEDEQTSESG